MKAQNPYVGPRAFEEEDSRNFFGRDAEIRQVVSLTIAHRVVLLYAPSGAGKTSLLRAGLIPRLTQRKKVKVLPISRVGGDIPPNIEGERIKNIYTFNALLDLSGEHVYPEGLLTQSLSDSLAGNFLPQAGQTRIQPCLLVLDQFEELFTSHPDRYAERANFFLQIQEALNNFPQLSLLLSMREDYIAQLDPYVAELPDRLRTRFRLELLGEESALQAVQQPARKMEIEFTETAAKKFVNDLRKIQVQQPDGSTSEQLGRHVEPVQLQVTCRNLWEKLPQDAKQIGEKNLATVGDVDSALADYYADRVKHAERETAVRERRIREWFDRQLITEQGIRGQVLRGPQQSQGLDNRAIELLEDAHLVRAEKRLNAIWYELSHDRLIEPIRRSNAAWFQANLSPLQRQADLWQSQGRSSGLLLYGEDLVKAEVWAVDNQQELTCVENDFLTAGQDARAIAERERQQTRRIRRLVFVSLIIGVIAGIAFLVAYYQQERAKQLACNTFEVQLLRASMLALVDDYAKARKVLKESLELNKDHIIPDERLHAHAFMQWFVNLMGGTSEKVYEGAKVLLQGVAVSPDGKLLVGVGEHGVVALFDVKTGELLQRLEGHTDQVEQAVFAPDGEWLATGGLDNRIIFWNVFDRQKLHELNTAGTVRALAVSPNGKFLASGGEDNEITIWDLGKKQPLSSPFTGHDEPIRDLAFNSDGSLLASASDDFTAKIWNITTGKLLHSLEAHTAEVQTVIFHPNGRDLATGSSDNDIRLWYVSSGKAKKVFRGHTHSVQDLAFIETGNRLVSAGFDHTLRLWDVESGVTLKVFQGHSLAVMNIAIKGNRLFSASDDTTLRLWDLKNESPSGSLKLFDLPGEPGTSTAIAPDNSSVAVGDKEGNLYLYTLPDAHPIWQQEHVHNGTIKCLSFSPDGTHLVSAAYSTSDHSVKLWRVSPHGLELKQAFSGHSPVYAAAFSQDSANLVVVGYYDGQIGFFKIGEETGHFYKAHDGAVSSVVVAQGGQRLLSAGIADGKIMLWDLSSFPPTTEQEFPQSTDQVFWTTFSPDNEYIASVGRGSTQARILSIADNKIVQTLVGHKNTIFRAAFSPDGGQLITLSSDATVRFWEISTGTELFTLRLPISQPNIDSENISRFWDFDFHCSSSRSSRVFTCWIAVPLSYTFPKLQGKLVLYRLNGMYK